MKPDVRKTIRYFLLILLPIAILIGSITCFYLLEEKTSSLELLKEQNRSTLALQKMELENHYSLIESDVLYLAHEVEQISRFQPDTHDFFQTLKENFPLFAKAKGIYNQIRLIGLDGQELIRINYDGEDAVVVPEAQLQNKKDRYYFKETLLLGPGRVYASRLDLNIENKKVQYPLLPTIRLGMPVYDRDNNKVAILMLNYIASNLLNDLDKMVASVRGSSVNLLNHDGYWLHSNDPNLEWGFMFADKKDITFSSLHPEAWTQINSENQGCKPPIQDCIVLLSLIPLQAPALSTMGS